jgi:hypothetical protein
MAPSPDKKQAEKNSYERRVLSSGLLLEFPFGGVHFTFSFFTGLLKMPVFAKIRKYPGFFTFLFKSFQRPVKRLAFVDNHFRH